MSLEQGKVLDVNDPRALVVGRIEDGTVHGQYNGAAFAQPCGSLVLCGHSRAGQLVLGITQETPDGRQLLGVVHLDAQNVLEVALNMLRAIGADVQRFVRETPPAPQAGAERSH